MIHWLVAALISGYIGACELRAPQAWSACENRWTLALGYVVPSPVSGAARRIGQSRKRRGESVGE